MKTIFKISQPREILVGNPNLGNTAWMLACVQLLPGLLDSEGTHSQSAEPRQLGFLSVGGEPGCAVGQGLFGPYR